MGKKITIGLLFHSFCSSNLGVGALALSQCRIIESICSELNIEVEILSYESNINDKYTDCTNLNIILKKSSLSPFVMIKSLKQCDLIIDATGGDSFADIYGMKNFVAIMMIKYYSIFSGVPIILSPQTIGPFNKRISKIVSNIYLRFVKMIFLRDELSISSIPKYCLNKIAISSDMAYILPFHKEQNIRDEKKTVGFNISGLLFSGGYSLKHKKDFSYERLCKNLIEILIEQNYQVYIIPHVVGEYNNSIDNDVKVSIDLCKNDKRLKMSPLFNNPIEAKNFISNLDLFIGSRMHSTIAAVSSGVPTIPLAYSRKFKGLFSPLGYDITLDLTVLTESEIICKIKEYLKQLNILKTKGDNSKIEANKRINLYRDYLKDYLGNIGER